MRAWVVVLIYAAYAAAGVAAGTIAALLVNH